MTVDELNYWILEIETTLSAYYEEYPSEDHTAEISAYQELIRLAREGYKNENTNR